MTLPELRRWVRRFGQWPEGLQYHYPFWPDFLGLPDVGQGYYHDYSEVHGRLVVAWVRLRDLCGEEPGRRDLRITACEEMADHHRGWVVVKSGAVGWVDAPSPSVFVGGAACIPVPDWGM